MGKIDIVKNLREPVEVEAGRHTLESGLSGDSFLWEFLYPNRGRKMLQTTSNTMDYTFHPGRWSIRAENGSEVVYFEIIVKSGDDHAATTDLKPDTADQIWGGTPKTAEIAEDVTQPTPGLRHTSFWVVFNNAALKPGDQLTLHGFRIVIQTYPVTRYPKPEWGYEVVLDAQSPNAYVPPECLTKGQVWTVGERLYGERRT